MKNKSFTLIELLVVIVIIGILAGVIMISTSSSIDKANIAKSKVFEESVENNLAANMVSRWKLDEILGAAAPYTTPDQWGSNTGTLYGTNGLPQLRPASECVTGGCFKFDGVDDYVNCGNDGLKVNNLTISTWIKINNFSNYGRIIDKIASTGGYRIYISNGEINFDAHDGISIKSLLTTDLNLSTNNWYYLVTIAGNNMQVYKNGITSLNTQSYGGTITNTDQPLTIGSDNDGGGNNPFNGLIDDVKIYNNALSSSQIKQNYVAGLNSLFSKEFISKEEYRQKLENLSQK